MHRVDAALAAIAQLQFGTFSHRQARTAGGDRDFIKRRLRSGAWVRFARGAYGLPDWPPSFERNLWIALHAAEEAAMIGGFSAAWLHRMTGFPPTRLELLVPHGHHHEHPTAVIHQTRHFPLAAKVRGMPCVPLERTLCDVAALVGPKRLGRALDDVLAAGKTTLARVEKEHLALAKPGRLGVTTMWRVLSERAGDYIPSGNELERGLDRILMTIPGPKPLKEYQIGDRAEMPHRVDRIYIGERCLIVEADGRTYHMRVNDIRRDRERDRRALLLGYPTFRYAYEEIVGTPELVRAEICAFLGR